MHCVISRHIIWIKNTKRFEHGSCMKMKVTMAIRPSFVWRNWISFEEQSPNRMIPLLLLQDTVNLKVLNLSHNEFQEKGGKILGEAMGRWFVFGCFLSFFTSQSTVIWVGDELISIPCKILFATRYRDNTAADPEGVQGVRSNPPPPPPLPRF